MKVITAPAKRGAPRKERQSIDHGTDELRLRRILAVGPKADPAMATTPLGIMLARELIDLDMYEGGETYRRLYGGASGRARECGLDLNLGSGTEDALERITEQYRAATDRLIRLGLSVLREVINVAVFQDRPVWLMLYLHNPHKDSWRVHRNHCDCEALFVGLKELAR